MSAHALIYALQQYPITHDSLDHLGQNLHEYTLRRLRDSIGDDGPRDEEIILDEYLEQVDSELFYDQVRSIFFKLVNWDNDSSLGSPHASITISKNSPSQENYHDSWEYRFQFVQHLYWYQYHYWQRSPSSQSLSEELIPHVTGVLDEHTLTSLQPQIYNIYLKIIEIFLRDGNVTQVVNEEQEIAKQFDQYLEQPSFEDHIVKAMLELDPEVSAHDLSYFGSSIKLMDSVTVAGWYYRTLKEGECDRNWSLLSKQYRQIRFNDSRTQHGEWCRKASQRVQWNDFQLSPQEETSDLNHGLSFRASLVYGNERSKRTECITLSLDSDRISVNNVQPLDDPTDTCPSDP